MDIVNNSIPFFLGLLLLEVGIAAWQKREWFDAKDTFGSLAMGIGSVLIGLLTKGLVLGAFLFMYQFRIFTLPNAWWVWVLLLFADDITYYFMHRYSHEIRYFWASHVVHHSSQKYNLGTALRQTWTGDLAGGFVFSLWMPLVGLHPIMMMMMHSINLLYQFWIHTEAIGKLPRPFEFIFNTPSHHRVHHSSEPKYLDRNYAGIFIIWDRMFGTFQREEEHPTYGLTKNIHSFNPLVIAFHEWGDLAKDVFNSRSLRQAWMYVFGPPGWSHDGSRKTARQIKELGVK